MGKRFTTELQNVLLSRLLTLLADKGIAEFSYSGVVLTANLQEGTFLISKEFNRLENNTFKIVSVFEAGLTAVSGCWDSTFETEFRRTLKEYLPDQSFSEDSSTGDTRTLLSIYRQACLVLENPTLNPSLYPKVVPLFPRRPTLTT